MVRSSNVTSATKGNTRSPTRAPKGTSRKKSTSADEFLLSDSTGYLIRRTFRIFTKSLESRIKRHGISLGMWYFLRILWERDGLTQRELSDELGLMQPTTVTAMAVLEKQGLIERRQNADDRRKTNIYLTKKGRDLRKEIGHYAQEINDIGLENVTAREREILWRGLNKIAESLEADQRSE